MVYAQFKTYFWTALLQTIHWSWEYGKVCKMVNCSNLLVWKRSFNKAIKTTTQMQWFWIMWPELSQQLSKGTQVSLQTWRQLHNIWLFVPTISICTAPKCLLLLPQPHTREEEGLCKYLVSRVMQSCIGYFPLPEPGSHPFDYLHAFYSAAFLLTCSKVFFFLLHVRSS